MAERRSRSRTARGRGADPHERAPRPRVGVAGLGHVGLITALAFAHHGVPALGFDIRPETREAIRRGEPLIYERGMRPLLHRALRTERFRVVDSWSELIEGCDVIYLCLPTPPRRSGRIDLRPMGRGLLALGRALRRVRRRKLIVVKSTVVPGTTEGTIRPRLERIARKDRSGIGIAANPEFLAEGTMVADALRPARIVLGVASETDLRLLRSLHAGFRAPLTVLPVSGAELVKYASNAFLALKVNFANEISRLAEAVAVDTDEVMAAVGLDPRIGPRFLSAGPGFGGSCFEKDVRALTVHSRAMGVRLRSIEAILAANDDQTEHAISLVLDTLRPARGKRVALLGLAFKAGTEDVRESRAIPIAAALLRAGVRLAVHDPQALEQFRNAFAAQYPRLAPRAEYCRTVPRALTRADLAVIQAAWPEYLRWPPARLRRMRRAEVLDLRRAIPERSRGRPGMTWHGLGTGSARRRGP